jgi:hypothetical protein
MPDESLRNFSSSTCATSGFRSVQPPTSNVAAITVNIAL